MAEHTDGSWVARPNYAHFDIYGADDLITARTGGVHRQPKEIEANARLIAAAPDMLEALDELLMDARCFDCINYEDRPYWLGSIEDAIAKAKGETP